jgi:predicted transcriptional regulator
MRISDVLARKSDAVILVGQKDILQSAIDSMHAAGIGSVVVINESSAKPVGIVSQTEILGAIHDLGGAALSQCVNFIMRRTSLLCTVDDDVKATVARMVKSRVRHMVVLNSSEQMVGLISMGDLVAARLNSYQLETDVLRDMARASSFVSAAH